MEMTPQYLEETASAMAEHGFVMERGVRNVDGQQHVTAHTYSLRRGEQEHLVLECVLHEEASTRYYLELRNFHGLTSFSFALDSWKLRDDRVEFKYYSLDDTGHGLAITLVF